MSIRVTIEGKLIKQEDDFKWLLKTIEWLGDRDSNGGITTCDRHRGHGFYSDCAICKKTKELTDNYL